MKNFAIVFMLFFAVAVQNGFGQESKADQQKFIETVNFLEQQPLDKDAKERRSWAMRYSDKVDTKMCEKILGLFMIPETGGEMMSQYLLKLAAFKLENPGKKADENAAQTAALESALKVYEITLKLGAQVKIKKFEQFIIIRNNGKLADAVKAAKCQ